MRFDVRILGHGQALDALTEFDVDLAVVFRPSPSPDFAVIAAADQPLVAIMRRDHPWPRGPS